MGTTIYVYNALGQLAADHATAFVMASTCTPCYLSADHLGSVRLVTKPDGTILARHDYLPFGPEIATNQAGRTTQFGATDGLTQRFTGQERDQESQLDNFQARSYGYPYSRFTSPDPENAGSDPGDPQSWNSYAYGRNNPLLFTDPTGRDYTVCDQQGQNCANLTNSQYNDFLHNNPNITASPGGQLTYFNENGSYTNVGSATYYNEQDVQAANFLNYQVAPVVNGIGYATAGITGGGLLGGAFIGGGLTTLGTIGTAGASEIATGSTVVYQSVNAAGTTQYVGITNNFARRAAEHAARFAIQRTPGLTNLSRADARAVEQVLIEHFGLAKNGGTLLNEINSIAQSNPAYAQAIQRGVQILRSVGFPGF